MVGFPSGNRQETMTFTMEIEIYLPLSHDFMYHSFKGCPHGYGWSSLSQTESTTERPHNKTVPGTNLEITGFVSKSDPHWLKTSKLIFMIAVYCSQGLSIYIIRVYYTSTILYALQSGTRIPSSHPRPLSTTGHSWRRRRAYGHCFGDQPLVN